MSSRADEISKASPESPRIPMGICLDTASEADYHFRQIGTGCSVMIADRTRHTHDTDLA
jgi:hypothetical protein